MNQLQPNEVLSQALRAELVSRVQKASPAHKRKRARLWLGAGTLAGLGLLGGVGAAAAGYFVMPGSQNVTPLSPPPVTGTYEGTATIDLGGAARRHHGNRNAAHLPDTRISEDR